MNIIDSPLVVYRQPEDGEAEFPHEVKNAFYRGVAADFADAQVIILENDEPPSDVLESSRCGVVHWRPRWSLGIHS
jgi:hypothetical protein